MKLDKKMCKVIMDLEFCIGSECYNPNSYDGWNDIEGCDFRYPINIPNKDGKYTKVPRINLNSSSAKYYVSSDQISSDTIRYIKYKFGSNELYIGKGLIEVLEYLEKRYDIDFNQLENNLE